jgi:signal transduction histidine kinase
MHPIFLVPQTTSSSSSLFYAWAAATLAGILLLVIYAINDHIHHRRAEKLSEHIALANRELLSLKSLRDEQILTVSHQLKTPLTAIKGYASMLDEGDYGRLSAAQIEAVNAILQSGSKALHLVSDILDAGAIEDSASRNLDMGAVNMRETISGVIEELRPRAEKRNLYLYFDQVNRTTPLIQGDAGRLHQAVLNILENAITYTNQGGVTVRLLADAKGMRLSVSDTGIGIHPDEQRKLFEKFYRGEKAKEHNHQGNGMGMYIARKIIEAHGGTVWAESAGQGKGATFNLWLPVDEQRFTSIKNRAEREQLKSQTKIIPVVPAAGKAAKKSSGSKKSAGQKVLNSKQKVRKVEKKRK